MMFGLGPWELAAIFIVLFLVLGPSRLPKLGESLGETVLGFRKGFKMIKDDTSEIAESIETTKEHIIQK